jgi:hypothetical protein
MTNWGIKAHASDMIAKMPGFRREVVAIGASPGDLPP